MAMPANPNYSRRTAAPGAPAPAAPEAQAKPSGGAPDLDMSTREPEVPVAGGADLDLVGVGGEDVAPPAEKGPAATKPLAGKERSEFIRDVAAQTLNKEAKFLEHVETTVYHKVIKPLDLRDNSMRDAVTMGAFVASQKLYQVNHIPDGRTLEQDAEVLLSSTLNDKGYPIGIIPSRLKALEDKATKEVTKAEAAGKPDAAEGIRKNLEYQKTILAAYAEAGNLAVEAGDQMGVRSLHGLLDGQVQVGRAVSKHLAGAGCDPKGNEKGIKENYPTYIGASPSQGVSGIKNPAKLLAEAKETFTIEVRDDHRSYVKDGAKVMVSDKQAEGNALNERATEISHKFAVPAMFEARQTFLAKLGREFDPTAELTAKQKDEAAVLKHFLTERIDALPKTADDDIRALLAEGVAINGRYGTEEFKIEDHKHQDEFVRHLHGLVANDPWAVNYFAKNWKSREMAAALVDNRVQA